MSHTAPNINRFWANLIVEELVRNGVRRFFIAPGSRSSPLAAAVAQHPDTEATLHFDERGAAFAALGFGRAAGNPAGWITTSGTAVANGYPAIVEASQSHVPLVALTADRPPELRDAGANQAIVQVRIFGDYTRWFFDLPCPSGTIDPAFVLTTVDQAAHRASDVPAGPVHVNCPFREPLEPAGDESKLPEVPAGWWERRGPFTAYHRGTLVPSPWAIEDLKERLVHAQRGLMVVGELPFLETTHAVLSLAEALGWPVVADVTSQLRLGNSSRLVVSNPHFSCVALAGRHKPDLILRLGGPISSKDVQRYLDMTPATVVSVASNPERRDPGHRIDQVIRSSTSAFCESLRGIETPTESDWLNLWLETDRRITDHRRRTLRSMKTLSEPGVAAAVTGLLAETHALFVASSMPIRDVDMYGEASGPLRRVAANRGASGIDGTVASAFGYHLGAKTPLTLLIGDLALLHDLNSLALLRSCPVMVIAINNHGGGIFNFLPIADYPEVFEPWFTAPHNWSFEHAAAMFGIRYDRPNTMDEFADCYQKAAVSGDPALIEVVTDRKENRLLHEELRSGALEAAGDIAERTSK